MSLIFYGAPMSTASITELILEELGVPHERVNIDLKKGDTKKPEYLKLNPNGKIPMIVHDGVAIWESAAITMYLGETFGVEKKLYPAPGPQRGNAMKWVIWSNVTLGAAVMRWTHNTMSWVPADQHNEKAADAGKVDIQHCLGVLDESLENKPFLVGDYTLADAHVNSFLSWLRIMKVDFSAFGRLNAWSDRCNARPAVIKMMSQYAG